ncbi:MAG: DUF1015 domain-containing protein [Deltaproteobacteria bacterium]|nr:DUF1015 domain-containing protein [Deltaproteobacteria bacterium]
MEKIQMALTLPFRGISYDPQKIGDLRQVVAPPYDVISPEAQEAFYQRHPHNVIRLILNKETPADNPQDNRYTRSAAHYRAWLKEGVLVRAQTPYFYFLKEEFDLPPGHLGGGVSAPPRKIRQGFIGLIRLEEFGAGVVLPHEKTQAKPKADRLALMEACCANFSQIFSLYSDEEGAMKPIYQKVFSSPEGPSCDIRDEDGVRHLLWKVSGSQIISRVTEIMRPKKVFIADGHHRYETALAYRERQRSRFPRETGRETHHFTMMYLAAVEDKGLLILPTHRVVNDLKDFNTASFLGQLSANFSIASFPFEPKNEEVVRERFLRELASRSDKGRALGMVLRERDQYDLLTLKSDRALDEAAPMLAPTLKALDVNLLHILIFQKLLKIGPAELAAGKNVVYFKDPKEAALAVRSSQVQMAFFLNPTKVYQVRDVALAGETMPSKSTFFYPKLLSGLVINPLEPDEGIAVG